MPAGKIFAISFAINAMMGGSFSTAMSQASNAMGRLDEKIRDLNAEQKRLNNAWSQSQAAVRDYQNKIQSLKAQLEAGKISQSQYDSAVRRAGEAMRASAMSVEEYRTHMARLRQETAQTQAKLEQFKGAAAAKNQAAASFAQAKAGMYDTVSAVGMIAAPFAASIQTAAAFEASMSKVQAITRANGDEMKKLTDNAMKLGETTKFSATQAADAMSYLGMAGWNTEQIMAGMPGLLALAAAGGTDLARTADIVSDDLTAFGLSAENASHMADVFAVTATRTNTNVEMIGETMKYAAPVARAFGASMEETAALTGLMANAGVKASQAGTSLRAGFLRLAGPPKKSAKAMEELGISMSDLSAQQAEASQALKSLGIDMDGISGTPSHKMVAILTELKEKTAGLSDEQKLATMQAIFGTEAATGWLNVLEAGPDVFESLVKEMENCDGEAEKMARIMMDNAMGAWVTFKSAAESAAISIGRVFLPTITEALHGASSLAKGFSEFAKGHENIVMIIGSFAGAVAGAVLFAQSATLLITALRYGYTSLKLYKLGLIATGKTAKITASNIKAMSVSAMETAGNIATQAGNTGRAVATMVKNISLAGALQTATKGFKALGTAIMGIGKAGLATMFSPIGLAIMAIAGAAYLIYSNWESVGPFFMGLGQQIQAAFVGAWAMIQPALAQLRASFGILINAIGPALASLGTVFMNAFNQISMTVAANSGVFDIFIQALTFLAELLGGVLVGAFIVFANAAVGTITMVVGSVASLITGAIGLLNGLIEFITGVFTGNWSMAWQGILDIFSGVFTAISGIANSVLNGIQSTINGIVSSIKGLAGKLPSLGGGGGKDIAHNARGGIYGKGAFLTTFAEDSPEAAIPLDGSPRAIGLWRKAGEILGIGSENPGNAPMPAGIFGGTRESTPMNAPPISISLNFTGNFEPDEIRKAVEKAGQTVQRSFAEEMEKYNMERRRLAFG